MPPNLTWDAPFTDTSSLISRSSSFTPSDAPPSIHYTNCTPPLQLLSPRFFLDGLSQQHHYLSLQTALHQPFCFTSSSRTHNEAFKYVVHLYVCRANQRQALQVLQSSWLLPPQSLVPLPLTQTLTAHLLLTLTRGTTGWQCATKCGSSQIPALDGAITARKRQVNLWALDEFTSVSLTIKAIGRSLQ